MNISIERLQSWFHSHPKAREWAWFVGLWMAGLLAVLTIAYPIKWAIRAIG